MMYFANTSWISVPRSRPPGAWPSGSSARRLQHVPRVDVVGRAEELFDLGDAEALRPHRRRRLRHRPLGRARPLAGRIEPLRLDDPAPCRARARPWSPPRRGRPRAAAPAATASPDCRRCGRPRRRSTSALPIAIRKSCAARPCRRSGGSSPTASRMPRLSHGPGSAASGQTSSLSPARIMRSGDCSRASSRPQMKTSSRFGTGLRTL